MTDQPEDKMGFFKRKSAPEGPFSLDTTMEVAASAGKMFSLIDMADDGNAKRELGHTVRQLDENRFELIMSFLPDVVFPIEVEERVAGERYTYLSPVPEGMGQLAWTRESYIIEPTGDETCTVKATVTGEFDPGLSMSQYEMEIATMAMACENSWGKLKVHAEGGVDEVRSFEAQQAEQ